MTKLVRKWTLWMKNGKHSSKWRHIVRGLVSLSVNCFVTAVVSTSHAGFVVCVLVLQICGAWWQSLGGSQNSPSNIWDYNPLRCKCWNMWCRGRRWGSSGDIWCTKYLWANNQWTRIWPNQIGRVQHGQCGLSPSRSAESGVDAPTLFTRKNRRSQTPLPPNSAQAATKCTVLAPSTVPPLTITLRYVLLTQPSGSISLTMFVYFPHCVRHPEFLHTGKLGFLIGLVTGIIV